ncbi:MAG: hypothetical protein K6D97_04000 [Clostridia bacterium]|nr:hypothetical protein [Clostridia bacterium]
MNKEDFDKLIEKYKKSENYEIIDELLEKQIIYFYSQLLEKKRVKFTFRNRYWMLNEIKDNLSGYHIANFKKFYELSLEELTDKALFEELEIVYTNMYEEND